MSASQQDSTEFRLPTNVKPLHYDLTFKTDLEALTFKGFGIIECVTSPLPLLYDSTTMAIALR